MALALEAHKCQESPLDAINYLASFLSRLGYRVHIRTALGGGEGFACLQNLRHVFLTVTSQQFSGGWQQDAGQQLCAKHCWHVHALVRAEACVTSTLNFF